MAMGEKFEVSYHYRVSANEGIHERHGTLLRELSRRESRWMLDINPISETPSIGFDQIIAHVKTRLINGEGDAELIYTFRKEGWIEDRARFDDLLIVDLDSTSNHAAFVSEAMLELGTLFGAYRGQVVTDKRLAIEDWGTICEARRNGTVDVDGRDSVYRFHPVMLFDRELCQRAFGMSHEDVAEKVEGICELVEVTDERVLVAASLQPLEREEILEYDGRMKRALGVSE